MIRFDDVTLVLGGRKVLENLNLKVDTGELVLLVGGSGSGKSTILKLILGLIRPTSGKIYVDDEDVTQISEKKLLAKRREFGIVFQGGALFDSLTVEENVGFFLKENLKLPEEEVHEKVVKQLTYLGLKEFLNYYPAQLSGGMVKRVAIARAVINNPDTMLYDEPTAGLDPMTCQRVVDLIRKLHGNNEITSVVVTHEIHYFVELVERMIMLQEGKVAYDGPPLTDVSQMYSKINV